MRRLVMHGVLPARIPDRVIAEIRSRKRAGLVELPKPRFGPGTGVRVISGPLSDQIRLVCSGPCVRTNGCSCCCSCSVGSDGSSSRGAIEAVD